MSGFGAIHSMVSGLCLMAGWLAVGWLPAQQLWGLNVPVGCVRLGSDWFFGIGFGDVWFSKCWVL